MSTDTKYKERRYLLNSPISNYEEFAQYIYALDQNIDNPSVFNVGIIAPYGSGKSSLVNSFFDHYEKRKAKMASISLASFSKANDNDIDSIEKSILEQIVFKRSYSPFSRSRIDRLHYAQPLTFAISLFVIATITLILCAVLEFFNKLPFSDGTNFDWFFGFGLPCLFITVFLILYKAKVSKIAFKSLEIELGQKNSNSVLNTFIDEVINFCVEKHIEYLVFEDIDRFENPSLFLKLREINRLINENTSVKNKVVFIYCVKDDIFNDASNKNKFFDFSISLVPVFNPELGLQMFKKAILKKNDIEVDKKKTIIKELDIDDSTLIELTSYVKELRVLNSIINDYLIYKDILKIDSEENDKLFAMMIYKNLFSSDFVKLQQNSGFLYDVFNSHKSNSIELASKELVKNLNDYKAKKEDSVSKETYLTEFNHLVERISGIIAIKGTWVNKIPSDSASNIEIKTYHNIKSLHIPFNINTLYYGTMSGFKHIDLKTLQVQLGGKTPFECEVEIKEKNQNYYDNLINSVNADLATYKSFSVRELIERCFFEPKALEEIKRNKFLYFAVTNSYIDELYFKYSGREDTAEDNVFLDKILTNEHVSPDYVIQNQPMMVSRLSRNRFSTPAVFNYSLLDEMLNSQKLAKKVYKEKLDLFISLLCDKKEATLSFLSGYFLFGKEHKKLIQHFVSREYFDVVTDLFSSLSSDDIGLTCLVRDLIELHLQGNLKIGLFNAGGTIKYIFEKHEHIIESLFLPYNDKQIIEILGSVGVSTIKHVDDVLASNNERMKDIFTLLFENNLLDINAQNLKIATNLIFKKQFLSLGMLLGYKNKEVQHFYAMNTKKALSAIVGIGVKISEDSNIILSVLQNNDLDEELKISYLFLIDNKLQYIEGLSKNIYETILSNDILVPKWQALQSIAGIGAIGFELLGSFAKRNLSNFKDRITDGVFGANIINLDLFSEADVDTICNYISVQIYAPLIEKDSKRSILIDKNVSPVDSDIFKKFKGMPLSTYKSLNKDNSLVDELADVVDSEQDYIDLIKSTDVSDEVIVSVAQKYLSTSLSQLSDDLLIKIKDAIARSKITSFNDGFLYSLIISFHSEGVRRSAIDAVIDLLNDEEIIKIVSIYDKALFDKLAKKIDKTTLSKDTIENNFYFRMLEYKKIVKPYNIRTEKGNVKTSVFHNALNSLK